MNLAPVVLFVYNRLWHTIQTVDALLKNSLAAQSELFIFSDGPKDNADKEKVDKVRSYIDSIKGFKDISIKKSERNKGLADSVIDGVTEIIAKYEIAIVLEDDLVSSPGFLNFMNQALNYYKNDDRIFSISGYCFPIEMPESYNVDVFVHPRSSSWGWATWLDRWKKVDWLVKDFEHFLKNKNIQKKFNLGGSDLSSMLKSQMFGNLNSWGIRWAYAHFKNSGLCLYPVQTQIKNIGTDKSGTHFKHNTRKYDVNLSMDKRNFKLNNNLELNKDIVERVNKIFNQSLIRKTINFFKFNPYLH